MEPNPRNIGQGDKSVYAEKGNVFVTYAGDRKIPHALTGPPFLPEVFIGREDELQTIHDRLFAPGGNLLLLVNGTGGVGKTSLASKYYFAYAQEYAHVAWVLSEKSIAEAMLLLALPLGLQFEQTADTGERLEKLLTALASLQKPCLLIIDNANEPEDLEKNYVYLRRCAKFHLLLTTRISEFEQAGFLKSKDCRPIVPLTCLSGTAANWMKGSAHFFSIYILLPAAIPSCWNCWPKTSPYTTNSANATP